MESGTSTPDIRPFYLKNLVNDTLEMVRERSIKKGLELKLVIEPELINSHILTDYLKLQRVLINLLSNAIKFTDKGEVRLCVKQSQKMLVFEVYDTGCGIPVSKQSLLFKRFSQIDSSSTKKEQGTGLGLSLCKKMLELMPE